MADSLLLFKRGPSRSTWLRARKARPHLILSYRPRRRLGRLRWRGRRRFRRRLLQAQAAGADWREGCCLVSRSAAPRRPKTAAPSPRPAEDPAPSCSALLPIPPVRSAGSGRAVLLLPLGQGFTFSGICRVTCLYGQVQVFGFTISQGQPAQNVFSTYTHSRLTINAVHYSVHEKSKKEMKREARSLLRSYLNQGPPFTHQRTPQKMVYYGKPSCKNNFENYIEIIKYVFSSYKRESPLIVNTMGWVADQGLLLLIDLIRLLSPSHVVQFSSDRGRYMPDLSPSYVDDMDGLYTKSTSKVRNRGFHLAEFADNLEFADEEKENPVLFTGYKLMSVKSEFVSGKTPRNRESHNKVLRELAVLSYLGQLQPPVPKPLCPLHGLTPYQVPFNAVALRIIHADVAPTHILYAVNASWVGLCKILDDVRGHAHGPILLAQTPICDCLGFGICRGIDMEKRLYHILTPVPPEELRNVNCLLVGTISIPQCVLKSQRGLEGTIPYITTDYNFKLPGASEKIGAREIEETRKEKVHPKPKFYRKTN
ncbi:polynucleotide 5'-hydroxyl-kinase NOL9 isoform 2-T2 [Megaptera novaeangliae]